MLLRIKRHGTVEPARLADIAPVPLRVISDAARQLEERGLARRIGVEMVLTDTGAEAVVKLAQAREESLAELLGDWWGPDRPTDLVALVSELTEETSGSSKERPHSPAPKRDHAALPPARAPRSLGPGGSCASRSSYGSRSSRSSHGSRSSCGGSGSYSSLANQCSAYCLRWKAGTSR